MLTSPHPYRLVIPILVAAIAAAFALLPQTPASATSASKSCVASGTNVYTRVHHRAGHPDDARRLARADGDALGRRPDGHTGGVQRLRLHEPAGRGRRLPHQSAADYDVMVGAGGCSAAASVTVLETITVTETGVVCQRVWVNPTVPSVQACASVTFTPATPPPPSPVASKTCVATSTVNVFTCAFTVTPAFPGQPGDIIHVNEPPGPGMTGPATFSATPTVASFSGCGITPAPVVLSTATSYHATVGAGGCPGTAWSVTFTETLTVTASGSICQSFYMVAAVPPATACASVTYTAPSTGVGASPKVCVGSSTPNVYNCTYTVTLTVPAAAGDPWPVAMTGPGTLSSAPTVASFSGCGVAPVVAQTGMLVNNTTTATYEATVGTGGCGAGAVVVFNETITVTGDGQICQTVWVNPMIHGVTGCAPVALAKSLTPSSGGGMPGKGSFAAPPNFGSGAAALAIFEGGSVGQLETAVGASGGSGVWVQDAGGTFRLLIANGPAFLRESFASMFPNGFPGVVGVTVTRAG